MRGFLFILVSSNIFFWISLCCWKAIYNFSDFAILTLIPLLTVIFGGSFWINSRVLLARRECIVKSHSNLFPLLKGRLRASFIALFLAISSIFILAWQALNLKIFSFFLILLILLSLFISFFLQVMISILKNHFQKPFPVKIGVNITVFISTVIFFPLLAWANYNLEDFPGYFQQLGLFESVSFYCQQQLPERRGLIAEGLSYLYSVDAVLLWLTAQSSDSWFFWWAPYAFSLKSALVCFIFAQSFSSTNIFVIQYLNKFKRFKKQD